MIDMELAEEVLTYIDAHPDELDMATWGETTPCGTTLCFAGHTAHIVADRRGHEEVWTEIEGFHTVFDGVRTPDGWLSVCDYAQQALGLSEAGRAVFFLPRSTSAIRAMLGAQAAAEARGITDNGLAALYAIKDQM